MLEAIGEVTERITEHFDRLDQGRERAFAASRQVVRVASACIKSVHREDFDEARDLLREVADLNSKMLSALEHCNELRWGGFVADAQKEYVEAAITLAVITDQPIPSPDDLGVDYATWPNGLAEAAGEFRRHVLDLIRRDDIARAERFLGIMEDIYHTIMAFDYPNAISLGLRGRSDAARGFVERTRGDLTNALRQKRLEDRMAAFEESLGDQQT